MHALSITFPRMGHREDRFSAVEKNWNIRFHRKGRPKNLFYGAPGRSSGALAIIISKSIPPGQSSRYTRYTFWMLYQNGHNVLIFFFYIFNRTPACSPLEDKSSPLPAHELSYLPAYVRRFVTPYNCQLLPTTTPLDGSLCVSVRGLCPAINKPHKKNNLYVLYGTNKFALKCHDQDHTELTWDIDKV